MDPLPLAFAYSAGLLATVNPCGWAMLPSFVSYYLGAREEGYEQRPLVKRAAEGLVLGLLVTAGFLAVFASAAIILSAGLRAFVRLIPFAALGVGVALVVLGVLMLAGRSSSLGLPLPRMDLRVRNPRAVFLFGVGYALASMGCTLPVFLVVVGSSLSTSGVAGAASLFLSYAGGMATVLMSVSLGAALVKGAVAQGFAKLLPYVNRVAAGLLILAGLYLLWYQGRYLSLLIGGFG